MGGTWPLPFDSSVPMLHLLPFRWERREKKITVINRMWWCQTGSRQDAVQRCRDASNLGTAAHFTKQLGLNEVSAVE